MNANPNADYGGSTKFYVVCQEYGRRFRNKAKRRMLWAVYELPNDFTVRDQSRPVMVYGPFDSEREACAAMVDQRTRGAFRNRSLPPEIKERQHLTERLRAILKSLQPEATCSSWEGNQWSISLYSNNPDLFKWGWLAITPAKAGRPFLLETQESLHKEWALTIHILTTDGPPGEYHGPFFVSGTLAEVKQWVDGLLAINTPPLAPSAEQFRKLISELQLTDENQIPDEARVVLKRLCPADGILYWTWANSAWGWDSKFSTNDGTITVPGVIRDMGLEPKPKWCWAVGKEAAEQWRRLSGKLPDKAWGWGWKLSTRDVPDDVECGYIIIVPLKDAHPFEHPVKPPPSHAEWAICVIAFNDLSQFSVLVFVKGSLGDVKRRLDLLVGVNTPEIS